MKKSIILTLCCAAVLSLTACMKVNLSNSEGKGKKVAPSANIVNREYRLQPFASADVSGVGQMKFIQTGEGDYRVVLSAPDNYVDLISISSDDGELSIGFKRKNIQLDGRKIRMLVYAPQLRSLDNSGAMKVSIDSLSTERLSIDNSGVGKIAVGKLTADKVSVDCSGVGSVELSGTARSAELECSGVGSIKAMGLSAATVEAEVSGVGGIECTATDSLRGEVSGVGSIIYGGHPAKKELRRTGVGKISEQ